MFIKEYPYSVIEYTEHFNNGPLCTIKKPLRFGSHAFSILGIITAIYCLAADVGSFFPLLFCTLGICLNGLTYTPSKYIPEGYKCGTTCSIVLNNEDLFITYEGTDDKFHVDIKRTKLQLISATIHYIIATDNQPVVYIPKSYMNKDDLEMLCRIIPQSDASYTYIAKHLNII